MAVNQKILVKIGNFWRGFDSESATGRSERQAGLEERFALRLFA
jgi:hypothetical protein